MGSPGPLPTPAVDPVAAQCRQFYERRLRTAESFREPTSSAGRSASRRPCTPRLATAMQRLRQQIATLISEDNALFRQLLALNDSIASLREQQLQHMAELSRASSLESFSAEDEDEEEEEDDDDEDEVDHRVPTHHQRHHHNHHHNHHHSSNNNNNNNNNSTTNNHHHSASPTSTLSSSSNSSNCSRTFPPPHPTVATQTSSNEPSPLPPALPLSFPSLPPQPSSSSSCSRSLQIVTRDSQGRLVVLRPGKGTIPTSTSQAVRLNASSCPYDSGFQGSESDADNNEIFV